MKKLVQICFIVFLFIQQGYSQSIKLGVKAGLNYSNVTGSEINTDAITSYHAGIVARFSIIEGLAFQPELLYSTQGATYNTALNDFKNELGYITIPAMLQINIFKSVTLDLGPQAGFLLSEKNNLDVNDTKTFDFTANAGLGLKITNNLFAQARYGLGLTEIKTDSKIKNSVFQLSLGILF